ncbi:LysM peptidoglycan-binding domain-containing protein [Weissella cibaria]|uniref:LysM domain-containing protein n=1 Tax=Weissella cibaria TaxID=137591 RepID=A0A9Q8N9Q7_9LACO|nr:LysM peptidoglycan-binding domain-containing protein [Weissella cibaria]TVV33000.1 hypothetical protein FO435_00090 [Weissella cibaria]TVV39361.1 hypothetical protein FO438_11790 [Weissella cibaria]TVV39388.1 hypothetical protein FO438_11945 [Weissella cibaria]
MSLIINPAKLFKSGKFMMTAAATIAVVASATATTLTSVNADDSATSQKVEPSENHTYKGQEYDAPIRVETHDIWTANSESVIADNMSKQGIKSVDQLPDYKVVWGDTLSTIAAHFHVSTDELVQRFNIADANYIAAGITMKNQVNINALESQIVHDAQWNGEYNAKVAASQASDAAQSTGASDVANAQANATVATPDATPTVQAPVANTDVPAQAAQSSDTHVGGASDVINNIADGAKTNQTPVATPATEAPAEAQKPEAQTPKTDAPAPTTNTDKGADTNIGNASDVIKGVDDGKDTPAAQPAPVEAQKPASEAPKADAPATNTDKGNDTNIGNASDVMNGVDNGKDTPADKPASAAPVEAQTPASETPKTDVPAGSESATPTAPATPVETQSPASEAPVANDKPEAQAPTNTTVPANPVDGSTFIALSPSSNGSFGGSYGPLTYHTSFSGISVSDLTHGAQQGLWLDTNGNALNPYYPVEIFYTKQDVDNLVTRYNDAQTPVPGTELERPDQLVGGASGVMNSIG